MNVCESCKMFVVSKI